MNRFAAVRLAACLVSLALVTLFATRESPAQSLGRSTSPDSALGETLTRIAGQSLSLEDAVEAALEFSTDVREAEEFLRAARGASRRENGAFDPVLFADFEFGDNDIPALVPFAGAPVVEESQTFGAAGARLKLAIGTEFRAALETNRLKSNNVFQGFNPAYTTRGVLEVRQPLLKGFGPATSADRTFADREVEAAFSRYENIVLSMEAQVTGTYWDLYAAERDYAVQLLIVDQAEAFLVEARTRSSAGLVGPNEVATARVFLAEQQLALLDALEHMDEVSDALGVFMGRRPSIDSPRFRPSTEPAEEFPIEEQHVLLERALKQNGEMLAAQRNLEAAQALEKGAKWDAYPTLDLTGVVGGNGLAGTGQAVGDDSTLVGRDTGMGDAIEQVFKADNPLWGVGVHLSIPIGFREGRGERDRLRAEVDRARELILEIERKLEAEIRFFHRELVNGTRRLEYALDGVNASLEQVRIGQIEYGNGRTTAFELVRLGADAAEAQQRYSDALVRTAKAYAELERLAPKELASTRMGKSP